MRSFILLAALLIIFGFVEDMPEKITDSAIFWTFAILVGFIMDVFELLKPDKNK